MTIKISNHHGKELFSFEADHVSACTIMDLFGPDTWDVHANATIFESDDGELLPSLSWHINTRKKKSVMFSISCRNLNLYTASLFQVNENNEQELIVPESWEQVLEWGR